jgi:hypothetical protein
MTTTTTLTTMGNRPLTVAEFDAEARAGAIGWIELVTVNVAPADDQQAFYPEDVEATEPIARDADAVRRAFRMADNHRRMFVVTQDDPTGGDLYWIVTAETTATGMPAEAAIAAGRAARYSVDEVQVIARRAALRALEKAGVRIDSQIAFDAADDALRAYGCDLPGSRSPRRS